MKAVVARPPQGAFLDPQGAQERHDGLKDSRGLEGSVGKIAVVETCYEKDPHPVEAEAGRNGRPTDAHDERREHAQVQGKEAPVVPNRLPGRVALLDSLRQLDLLRVQALRRSLKACFPHQAVISLCPAPIARRPRYVHNEDAQSAGGPQPPASRPREAQAPGRIGEENPAEGTLLQVALRLPVGVCS